MKPGRGILGYHLVTSYASLVLGYLLRAFITRRTWMYSAKLAMQLLASIETPATANLNLLLAGCLQNLLFFISIYQISG